MNPYDQQDYYREWSNPQGLGFLPAAAAAPVIWPAIAGAGAAVGAFFAKLFGADDQKTSYRPPADAAQRVVEFDDKYGRESVSYDMGPQTQAITTQKGNRWDDVSSYYSAFLSNSTKAGASSAARRVIEDVAKKHGVGIARAADLVLQAAGAIRLTRTNQGGSGGNTSPGSLPGYCPAGTYHPYPIGHPQQNLCAPFPADGAGSNTRQPTQPTGTARRARPGFWINPQTGAEEPIPSCPTGLAFDPQTGQCVDPSQVNQSLFGEEFPWWILLVIGGVIVLSANDDPPPYRRARR